MYRALLHIINEDSEPLCQAAAIEALSTLKAPSEEIVQALMDKIISESNPMITKLALSALDSIELKTANVVDLLIDIALGNKCKPLRLDAIESLARIEPKSQQVVETFCALLDQENRTNIIIAVLNAHHSVKDIDQSLLSKVFHLLKNNQNFRLLRAATDLICHFPDKEDCLDMIMTIVNSSRSQPEMRLVAATTLSQQAQYAALGRYVLRSLIINAERVSIRINALKSLADSAIHKIRFVEFLNERLILEPHIEVKLEVAKRLCDLVNELEQPMNGDASTFAHIHHPIHVEMPGDLQQDLSETILYRSRIIGALKRATTHRNADVRLAAVIGLGGITLKSEDVLEQVNHLYNIENDRYVKNEAGNVLYNAHIGGDAACRIHNLTYRAPLKGGDLHLSESYSEDGSMDSISL